MCNILKTRDIYLMLLFYFVVSEKIQGGVYSDTVVLSDPVLLSAEQQFGPTDLGAKGISTFFGRHVCNSFCRPTWPRPADQNVFVDKEHYYRLNEVVVMAQDKSMLV